MQALLTACSDGSGPDSQAGGGGDNAWPEVSVLPEIGPGSITSGHIHSCALTTRGVAFCWGDGGVGAVGNHDLSGAAPVYATPQRVATRQVFKSIDAGENYTVALTPAGVAYQWGWTPGPLMLLEPTPVPGSHTFKTLSAGSRMVVGLTPAGEALGWGNGYFGDGLDQHASETPVPVAPGLVFESISAGWDHACGLTSAGKAYCWGGDRYGQLGDGVAQIRLTPFPVVGGHTFRSIAAGYLLTCALDVTGDAYCWGAGTTGVPEWGSVPKLVGGGRKFVSLDLGESYAVALTADGTAYGWNANGWGVLGDGTTTARAEPVPVQGGLKFSAISAGGFQTVALQTNGTAAGWGYNLKGSIGDGSLVSSTVPKVHQPPGFRVVPGEGVTLTRGSSTTAVVDVVRTGGFSVQHGGAGFAGPVTLSLSGAPTGVTGSFSPATLAERQGSSVLTLTASSTAALGGGTVSVRGHADGMTDRVASLPVSVEAGAGSGTGGAYKCPTGSSPLPAGFQCVTNSGLHTAAKYAVPDLHGTWVDPVAGLCITWRSDGKATGRYKGDSFGNGPKTTSEGEWGVLVSSTGVPVGTATQWYVFTEALDPQTRLLGYDSSARQIMGWGFQKGTCPW